jgi:Platelet-activating factor acetylhydrolase, isoform II
MNPPMKQRRQACRMFKGFAVLAMLGALGVVTLLMSLWLEHRTEITLPTPTGAFAVGHALYDWADDETLDTLAPGPGIKRELLVWIWYPAVAGPSATIDDYLPAPIRTAVQRETGVLLTHFLTRDLSKVHKHSLRNPDLSPQQRSYPVVIMRAGASLEVWNYSGLAEDLASHGYVVVGFDAPYRTGLVVFPDGRVISRRPENNPELFSGEELTRLTDKLLAAWTAHSLRA